MEKCTPAIKSKLERIIENTNMIISSCDTTDRLKSVYNSIKEDWKSLEGVIENWKQIQFTIDDYTTDYLNYEKFSENCKTNMQMIKAICEDVLAEIIADEKENDFKQDIETNKKPKLKTSHWLAIIAVLIAVFYGITSQILETRYDQGRLEMRNELADTLNAQQNTIQNLLDSIEKIKLRNEELEKCIKLKKTCK